MFGETKKQVVAENAYRLVFCKYHKIERGNSYQYEPWHLRYVGYKLLPEFNQDQLILEDYVLKW